MSSNIYTEICQQQVRFLTPSRWIGFSNFKGLICDQNIKRLNICLGDIMVFVQYIIHIMRSVWFIVVEFWSTVRRKQRVWRRFVICLKKNTWSNWLHLVCVKHCCQTFYSSRNFALAIFHYLCIYKYIYIYGIYKTCYFSSVHCVGYKLLVCCPICNYTI